MPGKKKEKNISARREGRLSERLHLCQIRSNQFFPALLYSPLLYIDMSTPATKQGAFNKLDVSPVTVGYAVKRFFNLILDATVNGINIYIYM